MRTNDPSDADSPDDVQRVEVRRTRRPGAPDEPPRLRRIRLTWRGWLLVGAVLLAGLGVLVLILGIFVILLPWILLFAAAVMVAGWVRSFLTGRHAGGGGDLTGRGP